MKFLCEQCKAKYQIADDKVVGKTVRMKCRKCGFMIEVRAEVTETSVAKAFPSDDDKKPAKPSGLRSGLATSLTSKAASPKTSRPDALAGAFNRQVKRPETPPESTASVDMLDSAAANGWYVAINGVPVGPIRVSELRRKAANGAITEDSLVWREGLEEWRPVRSVTEIAQLVREAAMSGRQSLVTPPPADMHHMRPSAPPPPAAMSPRPPPARPAPRAPEAPKPSPALASRSNTSNVVPFTGRLATAEKREEEEDIDIEEELEPISSSSSAAALATPAGSVPGPLAERASLVTADPFALPPAPAAAAPQPAPMVMPARTAASTVIAVSPPIVTSDQGKKPPNWLVIGLLIMFGGFGVTAAVFVFKPQPQAPQSTVIVQPAPVPNAPVTAEKPTGETPPAPPTSAEPTSKVAQAGQAGKVVSKATPPTQSPGKPGLGLDPSLIGGTGPNVGPGSSSPKYAGGITSDQVETTVRNYQLGVRRTCWERSGVQTPSVNVTAKVTVASNGVVQAVDAQGNDPVVAKCIESQVKGWHFPASGETTTVNIPFKFVRQ